MRSKCRCGGCSLLRQNPNCSGRSSITVRCIAYRAKRSKSGHSQDFGCRSCGILRKINRRRIAILLLFIHSSAIRYFLFSIFLRIFFSTFSNVFSLFSTTFVRLDLGFFNDALYDFRVAIFFLINSTSSIFVASFIFH